MYNVSYSFNKVTTIYQNNTSYIIFVNRKVVNFELTKNKDNIFRTNIVLIDVNYNVNKLILKINNINSKPAGNFSQFFLEVVNVGVNYPYNLMNKFDRMKKKTV